jgi:hypothetical protein
MSARKETRNVEVRNMKRFSPNSFNEDLLAQPWEDIVLEPDTDSMERISLWKNYFWKSWTSMLLSDILGEENSLPRA